jgi:hypothetical protein
MRPLGAKAAGPMVKNVAANWLAVTRPTINANRRRKFNPSEPAQKNPWHPAVHGLAKGQNSNAYFLAVKTYFAICALWLEAELRWITLLFTARSKAEL